MKAKTTKSKMKNQALKVGDKINVQWDDFGEEIGEAKILMLDSEKQGDEIIATEGSIVVETWKGMRRIETNICEEQVLRTF